MLGENIKNRRAELGISQAELARMIEVKNTTVSNYETGISVPQMDTFIKIMAALKCDANYLLDWDEFKPFKATAEEIKAIKKYRSLDEHGKKVVKYLINEEYTRCEAAKATETAAEKTIRIRHSFYKVSAGRGFELGDADEWDDIDVPDTPEARKADFALTIDGDSMEPIYFNGDIVLVKQQATVEIGEVGIFVLNGSGYIKKNGGDRLISLNEKYDDIVISEFDECRCFGKVVGRA